MRKFRILFICSGATGASRMAATFAQQFAPPDVRIISAGDKLHQVVPIAVKVMRELQLDIPPMVEVLISDLGSASFDLVITLCDQAREFCPTLPGSPAHIHWSFDSLLDLLNENDEDSFRNVRDEIQKRVKSLFEFGFLDSIKQIRLTLGSLLDNLTDGVMAHDLNRRIYYFNKAAQKITGYNHSEVIGRDCHEVFPGRFCGGDCSFCTDGGQSHSRIRYPQVFHRKDGDMRDLEMSVVNTFTPNDEVMGALVIFHDVAETVHLRRRLEQSRGTYGIIGRHPSIQKVFDAIYELADVNVPILIQGESGTGKEMVANALHHQSSKEPAPFVPVNCGALPEGTLESELFGHVKGAFTGAIRNKKGRFELAHGGTIFLDEIGELSLSTQVKLLRVLQEKSFVPVGGEKSVSVDVRIICASNKDLKQLTQQGLFREDLYYRLAVIPIHIPPLRERKSDIPLLIDHFLDKYSADTGKIIREIAPEVIKYLKSYPWSGNVRELSNAVQYAFIKCRDGKLELSHFPQEITGALNIENYRKVGRHPKLTGELVVEAIRNTDGNKAKSAKMLGVSRTTLYRYLTKHNM